MTKRLLLAVTALFVVAGSADAFVLLGDKWLDLTMDVPYRFSNRDEACIAGTGEFDELRVAFDTWSNVPGVRLTFQEQPITAVACGHQLDGFNTMSMDDCLGQIPSGVIASTSLINWGGGQNNTAQGGDPTWIGVETGSPAEILGLNESDIVFSAVFRFGTFPDISAGCQTDNCGAGGAFDIRGIMVHESGHLIGLGHSADPIATMRPSAGTCDVSLTSLAPDDENGARRLYDDQYLAFEQQTINNGTFRSTLFNAGDLGVSGSGGQVPGQHGAGFEYPLGVLNLYEGALILGTGAADPVSSDYRQPGNIGQDNDFYQTSGVAFQSFGGGQFVQAAFDDDVAGADSYGVSVVATMTSFNSAPDDDYAIVCYKVTNTTAGAINGLRIGLAMDWDFNNLFATNSSTWDAVNEVGIIGDPSTTRRVGVAVLNGEGPATYRTFTSSDPFTEVAKAGYLFDDFNNTDNPSGDVNIIIATGDFSLNSGESAIASFAILGGSSQADLLNNLASARLRYDESTQCDANIVAVATASAPNLPMKLGQNVPNPFNPTTRIAFDLEASGLVELRVYDAVGRAVRTLVNGAELAGAHEVSWDGLDDAGEALPSGMYFYRLETAEGSISRKMMLLK